MTLKGIFTNEISIIWAYLLLTFDLCYVLSIKVLLSSCSGAGEFSQVLKMNAVFFSLQTALCIYVVHTTLEANEEEIGKVAKK